MVDLSPNATTNVSTTPNLVGGLTRSVPLAGGNVAGIVKAATAAAATVGQYTYPDEVIKYYTNIAIFEYFSTFVAPSGGGTGGITNPVGNMTGAIKLPMPDELLDLQTVRWNQANLLQEAFNVAGSLLGAGAAIMSGALSQSVASVAKSGFIGAGLGIGAGAIGEGVGDYLRLSGVAPNQFITILLEGPEYKHHQFSWTLAPKTPLEAEKIRIIIQLLNNSMAPGLGQGTNVGGIGNIGGGLYWTFPHVFKLSFSPNEQYLFKFKPAVLTNFAVNYADGHPPSFMRADASTNNQNPPEAVTLQMQFMELEYWKAGDFDDTTPGAA